MISLTNHHLRWGRSEVVIIHPEESNMASWEIQLIPHKGIERNIICKWCNLPRHVGQLNAENRLYGLSMPQHDWQVMLWWAKSIVSFPRFKHWSLIFLMFSFGRSKRKFQDTTFYCQFQTYQNCYASWIFSWFISWKDFEIDEYYMTLYNRYYVYHGL